MTHSTPHCPNPLTCDADTLRGLLVSLLDEEAPAAGDGVRHGRAVVLVRTIAPPLVWVRDHKGVRIDLQQCRFAMELPNISALITHKVFRVRASVSHAISEVPVADMPEALLLPLHAYLGELPGYDGRLPGDQQKTKRPAEMHAYALFSIARAIEHDSAATMQT